MGTSLHNFPQIPYRWDHPHAYGDKFALTKIPLSHSGSSPRVWGQAQKPVALLKYLRIIPTRMGTRAKALSGRLLSWDHPHAYGDKAVAAGTLRPCRGSSPRVWGQERRMSKTPTVSRIIPTRMGTRLTLPFISIT